MQHLSAGSKQHHLRNNAMQFVEWVGVVIAKVELEYRT